MLGAAGGAREPDAEERQLMAEWKGMFETSAGKTFDSFEVDVITTQVVAGTNYQVAVKVSDSEYVHGKVHAPLPHTGKPAELMVPVVTGKAKGDAFAF